MNDRRKSDLVLLFIALFLPWAHFLYVFPITPQTPLFFLGAFVLSTGYVFIKETRTISFFSAVLLAVTALLLLLNYQEIVNAVYYIYNQITAVYAAHSTYLFASLPVSQSAALSLSLLQLLLSSFLLETMVVYHCLRKRHRIFPVFCCSFALFFPSLLYSSPLPWPLTVCLFVFWGILLLLSFGRKNRICVQGKAERRLYVYGGSCILISCSILLLVFPPQHYEVSAEKAQMRAELLNYLKLTSYDFLHGKEEQGEVELNRAGNRYYTGEEQFTVERERSAILYLKTLSASHYEDNTWSVLAQEAYERETRIVWKALRTWIGTYTRHEGSVEKETITIRDHRADKQYALEPYYLSSIKQKSGIYYDAYSTYGQEEQNELRYEIWSPSTMENTYLPQAASDAYFRFIEEQYLQLPDELETLFADELHLEDAASFQSTEEIITYIRTYLDRNYSYTLTPGFSPEDEDFIYWFLKKNRRGYCVHFASSAAMMLRYYGIPCRYVQGYRIDGFNREHKGRALDSDAHAWVEIFTLEHGWIPIEVTPGFKEGAEQSALSKEAQDEENKPQETPTSASEVMEEGDAPADNENIDPQSEENQELITTTSDPGKKAAEPSASLAYMYPLISLACILLLLYGQRKLRFHHRQRLLRQKDRRQAAIALYSYMQALMRGRAKEASRFDELYEKAIYSRQGIHEEEYMEMLRLADQQKRKLFQSLKLLEKWKLRYLRALD